jgi:hypothetical protein
VGLRVQGYMFMLMGTAEAVPVAPAKPTVFAEDLAPNQRAASVRTGTRTHTHTYSVCLYIHA